MRYSYTIICNRVENIAHTFLSPNRSLFPRRRSAPVCRRRRGHPRRRPPRVRLAALSRRLVLRQRLPFRGHRAAPSMPFRGGGHRRVARRLRPILTFVFLFVAFVVERQFDRRTMATMATVHCRRASQRQRRLLRRARLALAARVNACIHKKVKGQNKLKTKFSCTFLGINTTQYECIYSTLVVSVTICQRWRHIG